MIQTPSVSIIIPTYNRSVLLRATLKTLESQSIPKEHYEVIIVDDGSTDNTGELISEFKSLNLIYIKQLNQGSAVARNLGALNSKGELLIFIDDDILLDPRYVEEIVFEHNKHERIIGMGKCYSFIQNPDTLFARIYGSKQSKENNDEETSIYVEFTDCVTNNLSVEKKAFLEIGMMQDVAGDGPTWWGDIDFGYRARMVGYQFRRNNLAICHHNDYSICDLKTACNRLYKSSQIAVIIFNKYPGIQSYLSEFTDKTPISLRTDSPSLIVNKIWHIITSFPLVLKVLETSVSIFERVTPYEFLLKPIYRWILSSYIYKGYRQGLNEISIVTD